MMSKALVLYLFNPVGNPFKATLSKLKSQASLFNKKHPFPLEF